MNCCFIQVKEKLGIITLSYDSNAVSNLKRLTRDIPGASYAEQCKSYNDSHHDVDYKTSSSGVDTDDKVKWQKLLNQKLKNGVMRTLYCYRIGSKNILKAKYILKGMHSIGFA